MHENRPFVMSLAGFDPSGGAGLLADCKTFENLKTYGLAIPTANTLQTEHDFHWLDWQKLHTVIDSLKIILTSYDVKVVKIGIVPNIAFLKKCVQTIKDRNKNIFIIWDPIIKSSSGFSFMESDNHIKLIEVIQEIDLITPNFSEIHQLIQEGDSALKKATVLSHYCAVLLKGGHNKNAMGTDYLIQKGETICLLPTEQIYYSKHGSGCVLASAICSYIAKGFLLQQACIEAKNYIERFLNSNPTLLGYHD